MAAPDLVNLSGLLDDAKCFAFVRQHRWPEGVRCPGCGSDAVIRDGCDDTQPHRQRYRCKACAGRFDDLTGTALAGHHQPLRVWVLCLYFMGLNLSNRQIAAELGLCGSDVRLKLAAVSPKLLHLYAENAMSLEQLMSFTVTNDHARQEQVWESLARGYNRIWRGRTRPSGPTNTRPTTMRSGSSP